VALSLQRPKSQDNARRFSVSATSESTLSMHKLVTLVCTKDHFSRPRATTPSLDIATRLPSWLAADSTDSSRTINSPDPLDGGNPAHQSTTHSPGWKDDVPMSAHQEENTTTVDRSSFKQQPGKIRRCLKDPQYMPISPSTPCTQDEDCQTTDLIPPLDLSKAHDECLAVLDTAGDSRFRIIPKGHSDCIAPAMIAKG